MSINSTSSRWRTLRFAAEPAVDGLLVDAVLLGGLGDGYPVLSDASNDLLLYVRSNAMLFHMRLILTDNPVQNSCLKFWGRVSRL